MTKKMKNKNEYATCALFDQAIDKIRDEMAANAKDGAISITGEFLTMLLQAQPEHADKIMADKKTIKGAMAAMRDEAAKHKNGNYACIDYFTGIRCVLAYYGLPEMQNCQIMALMTAATADGNTIHAAPEVTQPTVKADDDLDIDALLAELEQ